MGYITCGTDGATIYYTLDGSDPSAESGIEYKESIKVSETSELKAIAVREYLKDSEIASIKLTKNGGYVDTDRIKLVITDNEIAKKFSEMREEEVNVGDTVRTEFKLVLLEGITEVPEELKKLNFFNGEEIIAELASYLLPYEGYNYDKVAYYDISLYYVFDDELIQVTAKNFPEVEGGFPVKIPYPGKANGKSDDYYIVGHMFSQTSATLGTEAGKVEVLEEKDITKSDD